MFQKIDSWVRKRYSTAFLLVLLIASVNLFINLGNDPVKDWDEARHGITSAEMLKNGDWIRTTYLGQADYWNLKPPLGIWTIAASFAAFGVNPFALRFPSALSAWFCVLLVMLIAQRRYSKTVAVLAGLILSTTFAFIHVHSGRTGDFDAMLTLFLTLEIFLLTVCKDGGKKALFYLAVLTVPLAFLLKSFAAIMPLGILLLFVVFEKYYKKLTVRDWIVTGLILALPIAGWAVARFLQDGFTFLSQMAGYDLLKRGTTALEGHASSVFYYFEPFLLYAFPWSWVFVFFLFFSIKIIRGRKGRFGGFSFSSYFNDPLNWIWLAVPVAVVFLVRTKTAWYLDPVYPAMAVFAAWHVNRFLAGLKNRPTIRIICLTLAGFLVLTEGVILAFHFNPVLSLALNRGGNFSSLEREIRFQKLVLSIPGNTGRSIRIIPDEWSQSRLFCALTVKGLQPVSTSTNASTNGLYILTTNTEKPGPGLVSFNATWSLYLVTNSGQPDRSRR